jgi:hypothetical protein
MIHRPGARNPTSSVYPLLAPMTGFAQIQHTLFFEPVLKYEVPRANMSTPFPRVQSSTSNLLMLRFPKSVHALTMRDEVRHPASQLGRRQDRIARSSKACDRADIGSPPLYFIHPKANLCSRGRIATIIRFSTRNDINSSHAFAREELDNIGWPKSS